MGDTRIEWAEKTWNPITGCTPVSAGCQNCYAKRMAQRLRGRCGYPADDPFRVTVHPDRLGQPLRWKKPSVIFVCSMGDIFHLDAPFEFVCRVFQIIAKTPHHQYVILTKREVGMLVEMTESNLVRPTMYQNTAVGVSIETQDVLRDRIRELLEIPVKHRFVSCEPLLGPIRFSRRYLNGLSGVIVGSETGPGARPFNPDWARSIRDQCEAAGVNFFLKQMGKRPGKDRILDGVTHDAVPWGVR